MTTYTKKDAINELSADQLDLMAKSDPSFVVRFLADNSTFDAHRVRVMGWPAARVLANSRLRKEINNATLRLPRMRMH